MVDGKLYFGGMSTDLEIKALREHVAEAKPGDVLRHEAIERVVGVERSSNRYRAIVSRFKKLLFSERNIELKSMRLEGYLVMTPSDRVRKVVEDSNRIHGHLRKVHFRTAAIPRASLTKEEEKLADHAQLVTAKICDEMATARKQIAPPSPVQQ